MTGLLIDTNAWIHFFEDSPRLSGVAADLLEAKDSHCFVSIASIWEAAIKVGLGKLKLPYDLTADLPGLLEDNGFRVLPVDVEDALGVGALPPIHGDPFDRIQVMQAKRRKLTVISRDAVFDAYGLDRVW